MAHGEHEPDDGTTVSVAALTKALTTHPELLARLTKLARDVANTAEITATINALHRRLDAALEKAGIPASHPYRRQVQRW